MTSQLQHGIERFRRRAVCEAGGQVVPPLLKSVQQVRQRLHRVSPLLRSTAPIGRTAVSDNHRRLRWRRCDGSLAPCPIGCGSLGGGRGAIAAGWWSWHPGLISRDASRVQWLHMLYQLGLLTAGLSAGQRRPNRRRYRNNLAFGHEPLIDVGERSGQLRPYVRPVARRLPLAIMGVRMRVRHQSSRRARGTEAFTVLPELFLTTAFPITWFSFSCRISRAYARRPPSCARTSRRRFRCARKTSLRVINAHAMRAILFAKATVTSLTGRRSRIPLVQTPAALFQCGA